MASEDQDGAVPDETDADRAESDGSTAPDEDTAPSATAESDGSTEEASNSADETPIEPDGGAEAEGVPDGEGVGAPDGTADADGGTTQADGNERNPGPARDPIDVTATHLELPGVDEATAADLADAGIEASAVRDRSVSYRDVLDAGVDRETATQLRREFSLPYSQRFGDGLTDRSNEVSGLQEGERDWVAASAADWEEMGVPEYDPVEREPEDIWADHDRPTSVRTVVDGHVATQLADCGVTSVRQLSFVDASALAEVLGVGVMQTRTWRFQAREFGE